jgi:hypothetical protein
MNCSQRCKASISHCRPRQLSAWLIERTATAGTWPVSIKAPRVSLRWMSSWGVSKLGRVGHYKWFWRSSMPHCISFGFIGGLLSTQQVKRILYWLENKRCCVNLRSVNRTTVRKIYKISISTISCLIMLHILVCFFKTIYSISAGALWVNHWLSDKYQKATWVHQKYIPFLSTLLIEIHKWGAHWMQELSFVWQQRPLMYAMLLGNYHVKAF